VDQAEEEQQRQALGEVTLEIVQSSLLLLQL
jgi:hypothetical protein